ncbi:MULTISPECIES: hypothetical protein [Halomonadaceae]|uniref:Uncharacterized protein n=1 Tax=Vreelandella titanicae TaxID=664683 RepID=A0AAP9NKG8_9GAMM|nr:MULTISPECIES: hypothetical protein [Halomonas]QKS23543.1 hypothetical protein FX987_01302 [Halomonas titanicae]CDG55217.1 conserved hypothetical protein [Halomonas sp. A3H3]SDI36306.1 hypothetical protein SAMN04487867_10580 [Halomonas titanicae]
MPLTIESALEDVAIERTEKTEAGYSFWLKEIPVEVRVALSVNPASGGFNFHLSHYINTPSQIGVYRPSRLGGDYEAYALRQAVTAITHYYNVAVEAGHEPSQKWLVSNELGI